MHTVEPRIDTLPTHHLDPMIGQLTGTRTANPVQIPRTHHTKTTQRLPLHTPRTHLLHIHEHLAKPNHHSTKHQTLQAVSCQKLHGRPFRARQYNFSLMTR
jgi:hypothetical protein